MTIDAFELMATVLRAEVHTFIGRLGRDPEARYFEGGSCVASARMAVDRPDRRKDDDSEPDWFTVEFWGEQAQAFADGYVKGDMIRVEGRIKADQWTDRATGEVKSKLVIKANAIAKLRPATPRGEGGAPPAAPAAAPPAQPAQPAQWAQTPAAPPAPPAAPSRPAPF